MGQNHRTQTKGRVTYSEKQKIGMEILKSASKLVFIIMSLASVGALFQDKITGEQFLVLVSMAFSFYFSNKGDISSKVPFLGK
jgi:hypothetical protein